VFSLYFFTLNVSPRDHERPAVVRRADVLATVVVGDVAVEELRRGVAVQGHAVRLHRELGDGGRALLVGGLGVDGGQGGVNLHGRGGHAAGEARQQGEAVELEGRVELVHREDGRAGHAQRGGKVDGEAAEADEGRRVVVGGDAGTGREGQEAVAVAEAVHLHGHARRLGVDVPAVEELGAGAGDVLGGAQAEVDGLDGPLELLHQDVVLILVDAGDLATMDADEAEADALDEDVVDLGIHEDVVDVELGGEDVGDDDGVGAGGVEARVGAEVLEDLVGGGELQVDEALAIGDGNAGNRKTRRDSFSFFRFLAYIGREGKRENSADSGLQALLPPPPFGGDLTIS